MTKKDYKIAIFGGIITVIASGVYDYIKDKPILSTIGSFFAWIWENIFEFEIKIWQLLIGLFILAILYVLIKSKNAKPNFSFRDYKEDSIHGTKWTWFWEHNFLENKWEVRNLTPVCDNCNTRMKIDSSYGYGLTAKCPRCDNQQTGIKDRETVEAIIIDNIRQDLHLDKLNKPK